jgi:hydrogenase maturation protease
MMMELSQTQSPSELLLIGIGNEFRGDDGLGPLVAREVKRRSLPGVAVVEESGEGTSLMQAWEGSHRVIVVDAVSSGQIPGTLHQFDVATLPLPRRFFHSSSHTFGLAEAIELARELHTLPGSMLVYGIEGEVFEAGVGLSQRVVKSVPELLQRMEEKLKTRQW